MKEYVLPIFIRVVMLLSTTTGLYAQEVLTLEEAIQIGLENNFDIRLAQKEEEALVNNQSFAKYSFLPVIGAAASKNFEIANVEQGRNFDGRDTVITFNNATGNQLTGSVDLAWTIFDGFRMFISYERLNVLRKAGNLNLEAVLAASIADISRAYYQIILENEKVKVLKNTLELSEKRVDIAKAIFEVGRSSKLELLAAQGDLNTDRSALISQEALYFNSKIELNTILGRNLDVEFTVENSIEANKNLLFNTLEEALVDNNPNLLVSKINRNISDLEMKNIKAERFPEINIGAGYRYTNSEPLASFASYTKYSGYYYGLNASFNILNGFDISRRIQNEKINGEINDTMYKQLLADLKSGLRTMFQSYQNSIKLVELESTNLEIAKESEEIAYERYKLGVANFLELREAQRNAVAAESRLLNALFNTKVAEIELLRLSGQLFMDMP